MEKHIVSLLNKSKRNMEGVNRFKTYRDLLKDPDQRLFIISRTDIDDETVYIEMGNHIFDLAFPLSRELSKLLVSGKSDVLMIVALTALDDQGAPFDLKEKCVESFTQSLLDNNGMIRYLYNNEDYIDIYTNMTVADSVIQN